MARDSKISWTDSTWNPWIGCHKVSPGCKNCYAETLVENRMGRKFSEIRRASPATFNAPLRWNSILGDYETGDMHYVFTCSISDFFIEEADAWRDEAWDIIRRTPHLTYQILTKRPERIEAHLPADWESPQYDHVWFGISAETQELYDRRWRILSKIRASVRFVSAEPLLGPIRLGTGYVPDWVIVGGETGPGARFTDPEWMRTLKRECGDDVPLFVKQITENGRHVPFDRWPEDLKVRQWPEILI